MKKATFAAGCFWCTEAVFKEVDGVKEVISGYAGGKIEDPSYEEVSTGNTGHVECVQIKYEDVSYEKLLDIYWKTHNPHQKERQGADVGSQYQAIIFYHNEDQKKLAQESLKKIEKETEKKVYTLIRPFTNFYAAEEYHQDFYEKKPWHPYCIINIRPKLKKVNDD